MVEICSNVYELQRSLLLIFASGVANALWCVYHWLNAGRQYYYLSVFNCLGPPLTFIRPGEEGPHGRCWLKSGVPEPQGDEGIAPDSQGKQQDLSQLWFESGREQIRKQGCFNLLEFGGTGEGKKTIMFPINLGGCTTLHTFGQTAFRFSPTLTHVIPLLRVQCLNSPRQTNAAFQE
jgi:hypothetical protein